MGEEVSNRQVVLRDYVTGFPKESDMLLKTSSIKLRVPQDDEEDSTGTGAGAILVKNLYLSCDPYMRHCMNKMDGGFIQGFAPGLVSVTL